MLLDNNIKHVGQLEFCISGSTIILSRGFDWISLFLCSCLPKKSFIWLLVSKMKFLFLFLVLSEYSTFRSYRHR